MCVVICFLISAQEKHTLRMIIFKRLFPKLVTLQHHTMTITCQLRLPIHCGQHSTSNFNTLCTIVVAEKEKTSNITVHPYITIRAVAVGFRQPLFYYVFYKIGDKLHIKLGFWNIAILVVHGELFTSIHYILWFNSHIRISLFIRKILKHQFKVRQ